MDTTTIFLHIAGILVAARVGGDLAERYGAPRVIGELLAGVLLGPSLLGLIEATETLRLLAEIGIILLLFEIGLEADVEHLMRVGGPAVIVAVAGLVVPFVLGFGLCYYTFSLPFLPSLFVGGTLTATSIGVTVRILSDIGRQAAREGQIVLAAAVLDDLLGVILLAVLYDFSVNGEVNIAQAGRIVLFVGVFFFIAPLLAKALSFVLHRYHALSASPGLVPTALVALVLGFAALAHAVGAPELLGGFTAGIALSRRFVVPFAAALRVDDEFTEHMHGQMKPIIQLFTPLFFVMVGLSLDLSSVDWGSGFIWIFSLTIGVAAIAGKMSGGLFAGGGSPTRIAVGMAMVPRGEVGLVFAELGRVSGVLDEALYAGLILVIAYTTLLSPFWIRWHYRRNAAALPSR